MPRTCLIPPSLGAFLRLIFGLANPSFSFLSVVFIKLFHIWKANPVLTASFRLVLPFPSGFTLSNRSLGGSCCLFWHLGVNPQLFPSQLSSLESKTARSVLPYPQSTSWQTIDVSENPMNFLFGSLHGAFAPNDNRARIEAVPGWSAKH